MDISDHLPVFMVIDKCKARDPKALNNTRRNFNKTNIRNLN